MRPSENPASLRTPRLTDSAWFSLRGALYLVLGALYSPLYRDQLNPDGTS